MCPCILALQLLVLSSGACVFNLNVDKRNTIRAESGLNRVVKMVLLFSLVAGGPHSWASECRFAQAALIASSESNAISRDALLDELASLYSVGLNDSSMMAAFVARLDDLAASQRESVDSLYAEIEARSGNPQVKAELKEQRRVHKQQETFKIRHALEPFLQRLSSAHRAEIETRLIDSGLVSPLTTGEVEFSFPSEHWVEVGLSDPFPDFPNSKKWIRFDPGNAFAIRQVPVTQLEYFLAGLVFAIADPTPARFRTGEGSIQLDLGNAVYGFKPNHPVESVSLDEIYTHIDRVSQITGVSYGLPSENEWEFAARAGSSTPFYFGDDAALMPLHGWFNGNSRRTTHEVGQLSPNGFSLFDIYGNVNEQSSAVYQGHNLSHGGSYNLEADEMKFYVPLVIDNRATSETRGVRLKRTGPGYVEPAAKFILNQPKSSFR
jgi:hypothetical protein